MSRLVLHQNELPSKMVTLFFGLYGGYKKLIEFQ